MPLDDAPEFSPKFKPGEFTPNPRAAIGDNLPKSAQSIEAARETYLSISAFLKSAVVIADEDTARQAKLNLDRGNAAIADLEKDMDEQATPLRKAWEDCRAKFTPGIKTMTALLVDLKIRMTAYALAEEKRRQAILAEERRKAEELRLAAIEAERLEREAKENAALGDCEADVGEAIQQADAAFAEFKAADNAAARAYREAATTTIHGGFAKGVGLKIKTTLVLDDWNTAVLAIGLTDDIRDAILKSARAFKTLHNRLPEGVSETSERKI